MLPEVAVIILSKVTLAYNKVLLIFVRGRNLRLTTEQFGELCLRELLQINFFLELILFEHYVSIVLIGRVRGVYTNLICHMVYNSSNELRLNSCPSEK